MRRAAEAKLQRSVDRLKRVQESVRRLEAEKAPPLTPENAPARSKSSARSEDRAISARIHEIVELIDEQPGPAEAVQPHSARAPPRRQHRAHPPRGGLAYRIQQPL